MVSSTESAMRSRLGSDDFMPRGPLAMPPVRERGGRAAAAVDADLHGLGLAAERNVAGRGLVPAGRHAHDRLGDLLLVEAHGVEIRPVGRPLRPDRRVSARHLRLVEGGVGMYVGCVFLCFFCFLPFAPGSARTGPLFPPPPPPRGGGRGGGGGWRTSRVTPSPS